MKESVKPEIEIGDVVVWREPANVEADGMIRVAKSIRACMERWGDGPFVVYEVTDYGEDNSDPEFWVTTLSGLHLGGLEEGEPSFSLNTMKKDSFRTMAYKSRRDIRRGK